MSQPQPGDRFSFSYLDETGSQPYQAVVQRILTSRQEGYSPEVDLYVADWMEAHASDAASPVQSFTVMLGTNNKTYIQGRLVSLTFEQ